MSQNLSDQFFCPSPKVLNFNKKRLHWPSVVRARDVGIGEASGMIRHPPPDFGANQLTQSQSGGEHYVPTWLPPQIFRPSDIPCSSIATCKMSLTLTETCFVLSKFCLVLHFTLCIAVLVYRYSQTWNFLVTQKLFLNAKSSYILMK